MNIHLQVTIAVVVIVSMIILILMVRKKALELRYTLVWFIMGAGVLILGLFPELIFGLSYIMGIEDPANMLFFVGFCFSLAIIFTLTMSVSRMSKRIKVLAQTIALLQPQEGTMKVENAEEVHEKGIDVKEKDRDAKEKDVDVT